MEKDRRAERGNQELGGSHVIGNVVGIVLSTLKCDSSLAGSDGELGVFHKNIGHDFGVGRIGKVCNGVQTMVGQMRTDGTGEGQQLRRVSQGRLETFSALLVVLRLFLDSVGSILRRNERSFNFSRIY